MDLGPRGFGRCRIAVALAAAALGAPTAATGEPQATSPPAAPACSEEQDAARRAEAALLLEDIRRSVRQRAPRAAPVETLDDRGHNYGAAPDPLADLPLRERR